MNIEKVLGIKFSKKQKASATALRWLLNDGKKITRPNGVPWEKNRGTGRSTLVEALIIERAMSNKGKPIPIFDHTNLSHGGTYRQARLGVDRIEYTLQKARIPYTITPSRDYTLYTLTVN